MVYHASHDKPYGDDLQHTINLVGGNGVAVDITQLVLEFTIYESIFRNFMSAEFVIRDATGIVDSLPIVGQEQIIINFTGRAARLGYRKSLLFKLYKLSDRRKIAGDAHVYTLKATSFELEKNAVQNRSPYYKDKLGSDVVQDVFDQYIAPNTNKSIVIEPTENVVPFIGTGHNPFQIIRHVGKHSRSVDYGERSHYLFYETREGYNFRTLASLFDAEQEFDYEYEFSDPSTEVAQKSVEGIRKSIIGFTFLDTVDTLSSLQEGLYDNNTMVIDPLTKTFTEINFNYARDFDTVPHIQGGGKPTIRTNVDNILGQGAGGPSHNRLIYDNLNLVKQNQTFDGRLTASNDSQTYFSTERYKHVTNSIVQQASLKQHGITITVPSNLNIVPGHIITIRIPTNEEYSAYIKHYGNDAKFLVTSVSNRLTKNGDYVTNLECVKESFGKDVNGNPVFTENVVSVPEDLLSEGLDFTQQDLNVVSGFEKSVEKLVTDITNNPVEFLSRFAPVPAQKLTAIINAISKFRNFKMPNATDLKELDPRDKLIQQAQGLEAKAQGIGEQIKLPSGGD